MNLVAPLSAFGRSDLASAGGKGANLGELTRAGFPVPDGFVVTTTAYASVVEAAALRIPERPQPEDGAGIRAAVEAAAVPEPVRDAILAGYAALGGGAVAVRSSATAEDLPGAAFAGQQDTYLNVVGDAAVLDAVRRCWGSLWTDRAIAYRARLGVDSTEVRIAVVVQRMVEAESAGVMFTANPVTGHREQIVVDASSGLGEAVVSGLVTPDHYVLDRHGRVKQWTPGRREVVIRSTAGGGVSHTEGSAGGSPERLLPDPVLVRLARLGDRVAGHFGRPQDIEWAYADGQVWLVQARPMTALRPPPVRLNPAQRKLGAMLLEYIPVRPYPIDATTWLPYGPAGMMARVIGHFGIADAFRDFLTEEDGVVVGMVPSTPHPTPRVLRGLVRFVSLARRYDPARWTEDARFGDFLERAAALAKEDLPAMPWSRLVAVPRQALDLLQPMADLRIAYLPGTGLALLRLQLALRLLGRRSLMSDVIMGARTRTGDANRALERLAAMVRGNPALTEAVGSLDVEQVRRFPHFQLELDAFLSEYGHRETASPLLATPPTLGEAPETVLGLVKVLTVEPPEPNDRPERAVAELLDHPRLRSAKRRARMERRIRRARAGIAFREDSHFYFTMPLPVLRRALLQMGTRLADAGILDDREQVFHLRLEELEALGDPATLPVESRQRVASLVRRRAAKRDELAGVPLLDPRAVYPRSDTGDALVAGTPASAGIVTGPVKVIREPADFAKLAHGDVLVCPYTNPSWTPLFQRAAAVVVDAGSTASHAAIVAREYGIPAVMGTADGTTVLTDGQIVTVDGDTGRVLPADS